MTALSQKTKNYKTNLLDMGNRLTDDPLLVAERLAHRPVHLTHQLYQ